MGIIAINKEKTIRVVRYFDDSWPDRDWFRLEIYVPPYLWGLLGDKWKQKGFYTFGLRSKANGWVKYYKLKETPNDTTP